MTIKRTRGTECYPAQFQPCPMITSSRGRYVYVGVGYVPTYNGAYRVARLGLCLDILKIGEITTK